MSKSVESIADRDPWDQQMGEDNLWYDKFTVYRLLGPARTLPKAYRLYQKTTPELSETTSGAWNRHFKEWNWKDRAEAWDEHNREVLEEEARSVLTEGLALAHKRVERLKVIAAKLEDYLLDPKVSRVSPHVLEQYRLLLDDIAKEKGERLKETRVTGPGGGPVVIETQWGRGGSANTAWNNAQLATTVQEEKDA